MFLEELEREILQHAKIEDAPFLLQRIKNAVIVVPTPSGEIEFQVGQGAYPGDTIAAHIFRVVYARVIARWIERTSGGEEQRVTACVPWAPEQISLNTTIYADDVCRTTPQMDPRLLRGLLDSNEAELTALLKKVGIAQNSSKREHIWTVLGQHAQRTTRELKIGETTQHGRDLNCMTVLGSVMSARGNNAPEIEARLHAARASWHILATFWTAKSVKSNVKRMFFTQSS